MKQQDGQPAGLTSAVGSVAGPVEQLQRQVRWLALARTLWVAYALAVLVIVIFALPAYYAQYLHPSVAVQAGLAGVGLSAGFYAAYNLAFILLFIAVYAAVAVIIFLRKPNDWMALLVALYLVTFGAGVPLSVTENLTGLLLLAALVLAAAGWNLLNALFFLFPDGRFVPRWTWVWLVVLVALDVPLSLPADSPLAVSNWPPWLFAPLLLGGWGLAVFAQIFRYRRVSGPLQRQQTKWVVYGFALAVILGNAYTAPGLFVPALNQPGSLYSFLVPLVQVGTMLLIPLSLGVAVLRFRLWDIDPIINRTLVYGALTAFIIGVYVLVVMEVGALFQTPGDPVFALLATGLVALLVQPLRERLQRLVNRLLYGERDNPYAVLSRLGQRLEATLAPDALLPALIETVKDALKLPYVAIALAPDDPGAVVATGTPGAPVLRLPLVYQGEPVGELQLAPRGPDEPFSPLDRRLLADLARQAGSAAHAVALHQQTVRLAADLQRSREQLVTAREEERRRLRRDLHDGLGPALAGLTLKIDTAREELGADPAEAERLLVNLKGDVQEALADVRRLVYALRPPALDEWGLVGALQIQVSQAQHPGLRISIEAPVQLPLLPAAVEVAAYRIVLEALTNVGRHAQAHSCRIGLTLGNGLEIEVSDDGRGLAAGQALGVGLLAMRERAAELGGVCRIETLPAGGTRVKAWLPLPG